MSLYTFPKEQRLTLKKDIEALFRIGKSFNSGPLRVIYTINPANTCGLKVLITSSKKKFRNAADRNRIKRLIREAFRLNRTKWIPDSLFSDLIVHAVFIFSGESSAIPYATVENLVVESLKKLAQEIKSAGTTG